MMGPFAYLLAPYVTKATCGPFLPDYSQFLDPDILWRLAMCSSFGMPSLHPSLLSRRPITFYTLVSLICNWGQGLLVTSLCTYQLGSTLLNIQEKQHHNMVERTELWNQT